jgi:hypothetical protein
MVVGCRFCDPLIVAIVVAGLVMIAAGMLVVTLTHLISLILVAVVSIHIAYETFLLAAVWAGGLLLTTACHARGL